MNIQIFGTTKCFDTKKAQRYFKAARPPWATSPMCGRTGSNRAVGFSQKNHGQGFALCAALWYTESQQ